MSTYSDIIQNYLASTWRGPSVVFAYLFGSTVTGQGWKTVKDVDVAVWFRPDYKLEEGERLREELAKHLGTPVDIVVLNEAPPLLRYEILRNGRLIFCSDEDERIEREVRMLLEYYDLEPMRTRMESDLKKMIREGRF